MDILNLDELETPLSKIVVLDGVRHTFKPFSVEDFINNMREVNAYADQEQVSVEEFVAHMVRMIARAFPTLTEERIKQLPMDKMKALSDFVKGQTQLEADNASLPEDETVKNLTGESN